MSGSPPTDPAPPAQGGWLRGWEWLWLLLLFFVFAGSPPPDVGESHYLTKAKHYWEPSWCAGDLFVESADAHLAFYWTFGWLTRFFSLSATAWIARAVVWGLLAWAWLRLSRALTPQPLAGLLTAALWLVGLKFGHMAGEWVVGGIEAKGPAYTLAFLALTAFVEGRLRHALWLAGGAAAFHVLVGGWLVLILAGAEAFQLRNAVSPQRAWRELFLGLTGAGVLALPGLLPALALGQRGAGGESEAATIYVYQRLAHHLVFHRFGGWFWLRHGLLVCIWAVLAWRQRSESRLARFHAVVLGAVLLAVAGIALDQGLLYQPELAARLLRFYWFRLSDALVPLGVAVGMVAALLRLPELSPVRSWGVIATLVVATAGVSAVVYLRRVQPLPGAWKQPQPFAELAVSPGAHNEASHAARSRPRIPPSPQSQFDDWRNVCAWIAAETPPAAKFLTPRRQQTFKWYAGRAEVVNWKDVPQDSAGLARWQATFAEVYPRSTSYFDLAAHDDAALVALARKHGAEFIVLDAARAPRGLGLPRVYPALPAVNPSYEVYRVPSPNPARR